MDYLESHAADIRVLDTLANHFKGMPASQEGKKGDWKSLSDSLLGLGLGAKECNGWLTWAHSRTQDDARYSLRLLHPMERALVTLEAEGFLLDAARTRLISADQVEQVLETCATLPHLPAGGLQVRSIVSKLLSREIEREGFLNVQ
jgi:hypothetical protein